MIFFAIVGNATTLDPVASARIAAISNDGDGTAVNERLLARGDNPGTDAQRKIMQAAAEATQYLDASVKVSQNIGIDGPVCFDAAPKFALMLRGRSLPGYVAYNSHHVYMIAETANAVLLIDPTIRQYFGQDSAPSWVPKIFVGTLSELKALYARDPGLPLLHYQDIYFDAMYPATRSDSRMISVRDSFLSSSESSEYSPLTEYFNLYGP